MLAMVWGGYRLLGSRSLSGLGTAFDSHEALIDEKLECLSSVEGILASVQTSDDVEKAVTKILDYRHQIEQHDERMIRLGEVTLEQRQELTEYWNRDGAERKEAWNRVQAQMNRLDQAGWMSPILSVPVSQLRPSLPKFNLVLQLPEPTSTRPEFAKTIELHYAWTKALRQISRALVQMQDDSSAAQHVNELKTATDELQNIVEQGRKDNIRLDVFSMAHRNKSVTLL